MTKKAHEQIDDMLDKLYQIEIDEDYKNKHIGAAINALQETLVDESKPKKDTE